MSTVTNDDVLPVFIENDIKPETEKKDKDFIIPYNIRSQFRPKLQEYFNELEKLQGRAKNGTYIESEKRAKEFFLKEFNIPVLAWDKARK